MTRENDPEIDHPNPEFRDAIANLLRAFDEYRRKKDLDSRELTRAIDALRDLGKKIQIT